MNNQVGLIVTVNNIKKLKNGDLEFRLADKKYKMSRDSEIVSILTDLLKKPDPKPEPISFFSRLFGRQPKQTVIEPIPMGKETLLARELRLNGTIRITFEDTTFLEKKSSNSIAALKYTLDRIDSENIAEEVRDTPVIGLSEKLLKAASYDTDTLELKKLSRDDSIAVKILVANNLNTDHEDVMHLLNQDLAIKLSFVPDERLNGDETVAQSLMQTVMNCSDSRYEESLAAENAIVLDEQQSARRLTASDLFRRIELGTFEGAKTRVTKAQLLEKNEVGVSLGRVLARKNLLGGLLPLMDNQVMCYQSGEDKETLTHELARFGRFTNYRDAITDEALMIPNKYLWTPVLSAAMTRNLHQISDKLTEGMLFFKSTDGTTAVDLITEDLVALPLPLKEKVILHKSVVSDESIHRDQSEKESEKESEGLSV